MFHFSRKNLVQRLLGTKTAPIRNDQRRARLRFEQLEDRTCPTSVSLVKDIAPGSGGGNPRLFTNVNGTVFFSADDGLNGFELWRSDGTAAGTVLVTDINPGVGGAYPDDLTNVNGTLFFTAFDVTNGRELWKSDGTAAGTVLVTDINSSGGAYPYNLTNVNGTLFFSAFDGNGYELWRSDGTAAGTVRLTDINLGGGNASPRSLTNVNGTLFFSADDGTNGFELWRSDGTAAGTVVVTDINSSGGADPRYLTNVNGTLFFSADNGLNGRELWRSDGTAAGTVRLTDINLGGGNASPRSLTNVNGTLFFSADDGTNGIELWRSDGTAAGTVVVTDINSSGGADPRYLTNVNGTLFFRADDGFNGFELWRSDGTAAGTVLVTDINSSGSASPGSLTNVNGTLFFRADDGFNGFELWRSDGTAAGTVRVTDINPGVGSAIPDDLTNVNGTLFFRANDGVNGRELWMATARADDFDRADSTNLGANWTESGGDTAVSSNQLLAIAATGGNALVSGVSLAQVRVTAEVAVLTTGTSRADLFARAVNTSNAYVGTLVSNNGVVTASIRRVVGGVSATLASASVGLPLGEGVLRFEVAGSLLKLFVNDALVASALDTTFAAAGRVGVGGTQFVSFDNFYASPLAPAVPFGDSFTRNADGTSLGGQWRERAGDLVVKTNRVEARGTGVNLGVYQGAALGDVVAQARVSATGFGGSAGLVARYLGTGDRNYYLGAITGANGAFTARIFANVNGTLTQLAIGAVGSGTGVLRFEVVGNSLKLFFNGTLAARATDTRLTRPGAVGVRGTPKSTFDTFNVEARTPVLFQEGFNRQDSSNIGPNLVKSVGNFGIVSDQLKALNPGTNLALRDGVNLGSVRLEGVVGVVNTGITEAGLVARAVNTSNYYYAALEGSAGITQVAIYKVVNNVRTRLGAAASVGSNTGALRFEVVGNSLKLYFDGLLKVSVTDNTFLALGLVGLRGTQNTFFDNFAVA
jgi:ELWxxDGT repeat protein